MLKKFKVLALTHKFADLTTIGRFHIEDTLQAERLTAIKAALGLQELMFLSTCNRIEVIFVNDEALSNEFIAKLLLAFVPSASADFIAYTLPQVERYEGNAAVKHLFQVASSLDSMVVGEREIITQFRKAYEDSHKAKLTGDLIRLVAKHTIELAKRIFTDTNLCTRPVSVVSLAFKALEDTNVSKDARILMIGAGQTNRNMGRFLKKAGYKNINVFNRTLSKAEELVDEIGGKAYDLSNLNQYEAGFDIILTCTGSTNSIITKELYPQLLQGELSQKIVIDLAIPADFEKELAAIFPVKLIDVASLKPISEANLKAREQELILCEGIIEESMKKFMTDAKERKVALAMRQVPEMVKEIRNKAMSEVFAKDLEKLDDNAKAVLEKMLAYVEKKYISGPIKMAKEIMLHQHAEA